MLKRGAKGVSVTRYQKRLKDWNAKALPRFGADGDFGGETETWVKTFQAAQDLAATGTIDGLTGDVLSTFDAVNAGPQGPKGEPGPQPISAKFTY